MATIDLLEETANYLLNHCFVLGCVEEQRAKYLYIQDHLTHARKECSTRQRSRLQSGGKQSPDRTG